MVHWGSGGVLLGPECGVGGRAGSSYSQYAREVEVSSQTPCQGQEFALGPLGQKLLIGSLQVDGKNSLLEV